MGGYRLVLMAEGTALSAGMGRFELSTPCSQSREPRCLGVLVVARSGKHSAGTAHCYRALIGLMATNRATSPAGSVAFGPVVLERSLQAIAACAATKAPSDVNRSGETSFAWGTSLIVLKGGVTVSRLKDTALKIEPAAVVNHWGISLSWILEVPYWHHEDWFTEVAAVYASDPSGGLGKQLLRITSDPWRLGPRRESASKIPSSAVHYEAVQRTAPPQIVPATLIDTRRRFVAQRPGGQRIEEPRYDYLIATVKIEGPTERPLEQRSPLMRGRFESGLPDEGRHPAEQVNSDV